MAIAANTDQKRENLLNLSLSVSEEERMRSESLKTGFDREERTWELIVKYFATIYISYVPGERMVESKSLKLYLFSFRNHGDFHEDCVNIIMKDLIRLMDPKYIEVWGKFTPRGGISIDPYCNYGKKDTLWEKVAFDRLTHHDMYPEKIDNR